MRGAGERKAWLSGRPTAVAIFSTCRPTSTKRSRQLRSASRSVKASAILHSRHTLRRASPCDAWSPVAWQCCRMARHRRNRPDPDAVLPRASAAASADLRI